MSEFVEGFKELEAIEIGGQRVYCVPPVAVDSDGLKYRPVQGQILDLLTEDPGLPWCPVCLHGPPGSGKTTAARMVAAELGTPFYHFQIHSGLESSDLLAMVRANGSTFDTVLSPLASAFASARGGLVLLDDVDKARNGSILSGIVGFLDHRATFAVEQAAIEVPVNQAARLICAVNHLECLPEFILSRMAKVAVPHPPTRQTLSLVQDLLPGATELTDLLFDAWQRSWGERWLGQDLSPRVARMLLSVALRRSGSLGPQKAIEEAFACFAPERGDA